MIDMIVIANLDVAVIAFAALGFVLSSNVGGSVVALCFPFGCFAAASQNPISVPIVRAPRSGSFAMAILVRQIVRMIFCSKCISVGPLINVFVRGNLCLVRGTVLSRVVEFLAAFGYVVRVGLFEHPLSVRKVIGSFAGFAVTIETAFRTAIQREIVCGRRLPLFAFRALFSRNRFWGILRLHQKLTFLVSSQGRSRGVAWHFLLGCTPVIIPQKRGIA